MLGEIFRSKKLVQLVTRLVADNPVKASFYRKEGAELPAPYPSIRTRACESKAEDLRFLGQSTQGRLQVTVARGCPLSRLSSLAMCGSFLFPVPQTPWSAAWIPA